ncbi:MAG: sulfatase [Kiritimatiellia bacterium]|nr:sulfatase [Kiritimatiellia bacterium]
MTTDEHAGIANKGSVLRTPEMEIYLVPVSCPIIRPIVLLLIILVLFCLPFSIMAKPNILVFLIDDMGWADLTCYGSTFYETPNIDGLAEDGILFTSGYAAHPVCSPTRAALMTGKNPCRKAVSITNWIPGPQPENEIFQGPKINNSLPLSELTIAETLKKNGYQTWFLGKWHLGKRETHGPKVQGFDVNVAGGHQGSPPGGYYSPWRSKTLKNGPKGEYLTDRLTSEAISLIEKRDKDKPFFMYMAYYNIHTPVQGYKPFDDKFADKAKKLFEGKTPTKREGRGKTRMRQDNAKLAAMVSAVDLNVGRILKALKDHNVDEETIIFFTSDNGGLSTKKRITGPGCVLPLRGSKGWAYEGGIRVPFIVRKPKAKGNGKKCDSVVISQDLYPTILELCDIPLMPEQHKDGMSFKALLDKPDKEFKRNAPLVWHYPHYHGSGWTPGSAIRIGNWKLIDFTHDGRLELYNLKDDLSEKKDLAKAYPEKLKELKGMLDDYLKATDAGLAKRNGERDYE